jgi:hypothetical protein
MVELIDGLGGIAALFSKYRAPQIPEHAFFVGSEFERDLTHLAFRLAKYEKSGLRAAAAFESLLQGTGLKLLDLTDTSLNDVPLPLVGAVVSGNLSISYFIPRREAGTSQKPVLAKSIFEGSSFYVTDDMDADFSASAGTRLLVRDHAPSQAGDRIRIERLAPGTLSSSLCSLSDVELLGQIDALDFANVSDLVTAAQPLLAEIASRRDLLRRLLATAKAEPGLRDDCELLNEFYKYVLHRTPNDIRLRLHVFRPDADVSPHAHRWAMVSYVLAGPCANKYYGSESELASSSHDLQKVQVTHRLQTGSCYAFADMLVHWFLGAPGSATLTLRGPAMKDKASEFRPGGMMPKFGIESNAEPSLRMTEAQFDYAIRHLELTNVL